MISAEIFEMEQPLLWMDNLVVVEFQHVKPKKVPLLSRQI